MSRRRKTEAPASTPAGFVWWGRDGVMALALFLSTAALFSPALQYGFINYDDNHYVTYNAVVQQGLRNGTWREFFVRPMIANWHPLTMVSHALDCRLYGLDAKGHHRTSILLHSANAALVFLWLRGATGRFWTAALAAALFAWHPLRVESVVWIAERKDVLSAFFGLWALIAYTSYVRRGGPLWYTAVAVLLTLGLLAKPMLVTFPFVLLLLDFWPYARWQLGDGWAGARRLLIEKLPLFALVAVFCGITLWVQGSAGAMRQEEIFPIGHRVLNAALSYGTYVGQTVWPWPLTVLYPLQGKQIDLWQVALVVLGMAAVTLWCALSARQRPYLIVGWLWFLGTLVPVIGLVQVGEQAHADRYTYWPHIGLFSAVACLIVELVQQSRVPALRPIVAGLCVASLAGLAGVTIVQERNWRDTETLFRHTIAHTKNNYIAEMTLGNGLIEEANRAHAAGDFAAQRQRLAEAEKEFQLGLEVQPNYFKLNRNLGQVYMLQGRHAEAARQFEKALTRTSDDASVYYAHGEMLSRLRRYDEAERSYRRALELAPGLQDAQAGLADILCEQGRTQEALAAASKVPNHPLAAAIRAKVLAAAPNSAERRPDEALDLARRASLATDNADPRTLDALGISLAAKGEFDKASQITRRAIELSDQRIEHDGSGDWRHLSSEMRERLKLYEARQPYVLPAPSK